MIYYDRTDVCEAIDITVKNYNILMWHRYEITKAF